MAVEFPPAVMNKRLRHWKPNAEEDVIYKQLERSNLSMADTWRDVSIPLYVYT